METRSYVEVSAEISDAPARSSPPPLLFHQILVASIQYLSKILLLSMVELREERRGSFFLGGGAGRLGIGLRSLFASMT